MTEQTLARQCQAGDRYWVVGDPYTFKTTGAETGGAYAAVEFPIAPGNGTPPHTHTREDEGFYVLEGEVECTVAGRTFTARKGEFIHAPRNVQHRYGNASRTPARVLVIIVPAGLERFFAEIGEPVEDLSGPAPTPDFLKIMECAPRYGLIIEPPA